MADGGKLINHLKYWKNLKLNNILKIPLKNFINKKNSKKIINSIDLNKN
jgi:hypothetical protein